MISKTEKMKQRYEIEQHAKLKEDAQYIDATYIVHYNTHNDSLTVSLLLCKNESSVKHEEYVDDILLLHFLLVKTPRHEYYNIKMCTQILIFKMVSVLGPTSLLSLLFMSTLVTIIVSIFHAKRIL